jgi:hypothetical protein
MNSNKYISYDYCYGYGKVHKEYIVNFIKELKQQIILIENKIQEVRIFYITNKDKYDYELVDTFFNNLQNFIEKNINIEIVYLKKVFGNEKYNFIKYYNNYNKDLTTRYLCFSKEIIDFSNDTLGKLKLKHYKLQANNCFNIICNEEEDKLTHLMLMHEKKLKRYENLIMELYPEYEKSEYDKQEYDDYDKLEYNKQEYDDYDKLEYNKSEYDEYDKLEYDKQEYDKQEYDKQEYDKQEYDNYDKLEYEKQEYDKQEYDKQEYDESEYEKKEYDKYAKQEIKNILIVFTVIVMIIVVSINHQNK